MIKNDPVGRTLSRVFFVLYLSFGGALVVGIGFLFYYSFKETGLSGLMKEYNVLISAWCILLASQIAGFSVYRSITNSLEMELDSRQKEKDKNDRALHAYYVHLKDLAIKHIEFIDELKKWVIDSPDIKLKNLKLNEMYYADEVNTAIYIKPLEEMLSHDLHRYTTVDEVRLILSLKDKILNLMHTSKVAREVLITNEMREHYIEFLDTTKIDTEEIRNLIVDRLTRF